MLRRRLRCRVLPTTRLGCAGACMHVGLLPTSTRPWRLCLGAPLQMVKLHDRDNSGCIGLAEFRSLHMQLTEIRGAFAAAARGADAITQQQVEQLVQQQGEWQTWRETGRGRHPGRLSCLQQEHSGHFSGHAAAQQLFGPPACLPCPTPLRLPLGAACAQGAVLVV